MLQIKNCPFRSFHTRPRTAHDRVRLDLLYLLLVGLSAGAQTPNTGALRGQVDDIARRSYCRCHGQTLPSVDRAEARNSD
jgi:hypothetical protein